MDDNQFRVVVSLIICGSLGFGLTRQDPITGDHFMILGMLLSALIYMLGGIHLDHWTRQTNAKTKTFDEARNRALFDSEG